jgi:hypothetical protein
LPDDAVARVSAQAGVPVGELGFYDFTGRQIKNHRAEIRRYTGFRKVTVADASKLTDWLASGFALGDQRPERVRAALPAHCFANRVEPPTPDRVGRIVDSAINTAEATLFARVFGRLGGDQVTRSENLARRPGPGQPAEAETDDDVLAIARARQDKGESVTTIARHLKVGRSTLYRALGEPADLGSPEGDRGADTNGLPDGRVESGVVRRSS